MSTPVRLGSALDPSCQISALTLLNSILSSDNHPISASPLLLAESRPLLKRKPKVEQDATSEETAEERLSLKRKFSPDGITTGNGHADVDAEGPARKKMKANDTTPFSSPTKAQKLEEDGFIILEDDVIELD
jgi:hypothetical protein